MNKFMMIFVLMGLAIAIGVAIYFYFYYERALEFWLKRKKDKRMHVYGLALASITGIVCVNVFQVGALVFLHIGGIELVMQLIHYVVKRVKKGQVTLYEKVYRCGIIPILLTAAILSYGYMNMKDVREKTYTVSTKKAIAKEGYRLGVISDLHYPLSMDKKKLTTYTQSISKQNPDVIILCGDIVDERTTKAEMKEAFKVLGKMQSKYGIFYVFGNHDTANYSSHPPFKEQDVRKALQDNGIQVMTDRVVSLTKDLVVVGREDRSRSVEKERASIKKLCEGIDSKKFILMIDHQPVELKEAKAAGVDLQISGHTHGGQIWPVGLLIDHLGFGEMNYGIRKDGDYQVIVTSGIAGWGYPIRTGHHSEYLMVQVKGQK